MERLITDPKESVFFPIIQRVVRDANARAQAGEERVNIFFYDQKKNRYQLAQGGTKYILEPAEGTVLWRAMKLNGLEPKAETHRILGPGMIESIHSHRQNPDLAYISIGDYSGKIEEEDEITNPTFWAITRRSNLHIPKPRRVRPRAVDLQTAQLLPISPDTESRRTTQAEIYQNFVERAIHEANRTVTERRGGEKPIFLHKPDEDAYIFDYEAETHVFFGKDHENQIWESLKSHGLDPEAQMTRIIGPGVYEKIHANTQNPELAYVERRIKLTGIDMLPERISTWISAKWPTVTSRRIKPI